jgi:hypothetical protein
LIGGEISKMFLETHNGSYLEVSRKFLERANRAELVQFLELRGSACYDDESTTLLREAALDDYDTEYDGATR